MRHSDRRDGWSWPQRFHEGCSRIYKTGENEYTTFFVNGEYNTVFSYTN